jgi:hypothetical protein
MRFLFGSIASLLLGMLGIGCNTVDPSECWPNTSGGFGGGGTIPFGAGVGATTSGDFISPPPDRPLDRDEAPNPCVTPESPPQRPGGADTPQRPGGANPFAGIDPQVLAKATLKASAFAYYMDGMLSTSMVDLSDPTALAAAFEQGAPMAEMAVDAWLPTIDPSTLSTVVNEPRYECTEKYGCPYTARCINPGSWHIESTVCHVNNCGSSKCSICPWFFPPMLKSLVFESWCAYVCTGSNWKIPPPVVAQGAIGIVKKTGQPFSAKNLAWCIEP